jgi:hypothetical protein
MEVKGILFAMLEIEPEYTEEYNRWYDLDHLPEHISKADVLTAKRYVAPRDLQGLGGGGAELTGGHPPYLTMYYLGIDDFAGADAAALWTTKDRGIIKAGRFWRSGGVTFVRRWRVGETFTRPPVLVSDEAVPYLAHRVDLLAVEGLRSAIRFDPVDGDEPDLLLHLLFVTDDPAVVMARVEQMLRYSRSVGRYPAHGGAYEDIAFLPYRAIVPLEYDFEW